MPSAAAVMFAHRLARLQASFVENTLRGLREPGSQLATGFLSGLLCLHSHVVSMSRKRTSLGINNCLEAKEVAHHFHPLPSDSYKAHPVKTSSIKRHNVIDL